MVSNIVKIYTNRKCNTQNFGKTFQFMSDEFLSISYEGRLLMNAKTIKYLNI